MDSFQDKNTMLSMKTTTTNIAKANRLALNKRGSELKV